MPERPEIPSQNTALVSCQSLCVHRNGREAIRDFNLSIAGECIAVEGLESGTLLEVLAGWRKAKAGVVTLSGSIVHRLPDEKLPVYWTGEDWLNFSGIMNSDVKLVIEKSGVRIHKLIRKLDRQETQILSTVSALLSPAQIILIHEPFAGMKMELAESLVDLFQKRAVQGAAIVLAFEHYGWAFPLRRVVL